MVLLRSKEQINKIINYLMDDGEAETDITANSYNLQFTKKAVANATAFNYYLIRSDSPVISAGLSSPIRSSIVGVKSASLPFLSSTSPAPITIRGTGFVV